VSVRDQLSKLAVAAATFVAVVGGWSYAAPLVVARMPLPDRLADGSVGNCPVWFVGSSSIERWSSMARDVPGWQLHNRGIGGALMSQISSRLRATDNGAAPAAIVFYAGENDINAGASGEEAASMMLRLVGDAKARWPRTRVFVVGLKPSPERWSQRPEQLRYNRLVASAARGRGEPTFIAAGAPLLAGNLPDRALFVGDGVHLNDRGYSLWSGDIRRALASHPPLCRSSSRG